jgi:hypothetical protein
MESSKLFKLAGHKSNPTDLGMWKLAKEWPADDGKSRISVYKCPLAGRFGCRCEMKVTDTPGYQLLDKRGVRDEDCHHPDKDTSKYLKVQQLEAIQLLGVLISPNQSARQLRRNLKNLSPEKRVDPKLLRQVVKVRAQLTTEQLDEFKIDDSFGSLV